MTELAQALAPLALNEGYNPTRLPGVGVYKTSQALPREPMCYQQGIIIVAQGAKRVYLDEHVYDYNPNQYLVMTLPVPAECETRVTDGEPLLAMIIDINMDLLQPLVRLFDEHHRIPAEVDRIANHRSLYVGRVTEGFECSVLKLCQCLESPLSAAALGEGLIREILYLILGSAQATPLFALARHNTHLARMERVLKHIHGHYQDAFDVEQLAALANMSTSSFHRNFRQATGSSPVQYLKKLRLTRARELLQDSGIKVKQAAAQVGYESPTQFSREFKRYFGCSPQDSSGISPAA
ncbi:MAG: AraC family transcriptional regulator [Oceanospirillales bacterium]|uniref:AraC-like DNA-binding protein n=1 Tax=Marinobacterium halophilum TaxID=267374 RepID=A0A2P8EZT5_9GAMM|nr:AraC family transcriptional regulator [Marinobacterium halophilum]MBR9829536.1 AraC family transcriptional regulator [Oceanospirillales bacterium]PSL14970.1 AraC-like DNA-binding protein [Marinobacterium halophilum]